MHYVRIVLIQEKRFMNRFLSETGNKVQAHKGVFWLIEDKLLLFLSRKTGINPQFQNRAIHMFTNICGKRFLIQKFHTTFIQEAELKLRNVEVQLFI